MTSVLEKVKIHIAKPRLILRSELDSELGGVRELAERYGVNRANISSYAARRRTTGFPGHVARWRTGPVYLLDETDAWYDGKVAPPWHNPPKRITRTELIDLREVQDALGGAMEIADMCSASSNQVKAWIFRSEVNGFPADVARWAMGPVWDLDEVWDWHEAYDPTKIRAYRRSMKGEL